MKKPIGADVRRNAENTVWRMSVDYKFQKNVAYCIVDACGLVKVGNKDGAYNCVMRARGMVALYEDLIPGNAMTSRADKLLNAMNEVIKAA